MASDLVLICVVPSTSLAAMFKASSLESLFLWTWPDCSFFLWQTSSLLVPANNLRGLSTGQLSEEHLDPLSGGLPTLCRPESAADRCASLAFGRQSAQACFSNHSSAHCRANGPVLQSQATAMCAAPSFIAEPSTLLFEATVLMPVSSCKHCFLLRACPQQWSWVAQPIKPNGYH